MKEIVEIGMWLIAAYPSYRIFTMPASTEETFMGRFGDYMYRARYSIIVCVLLLILLTEFVENL